MNATLWIDQWDHFSVEHLEEWAEQEGAGVCPQRPGKGYRSGVQGPHYKEAGG